jgi:hypothetical protein
MRVNARSWFNRPRAGASTTTCRPVYKGLVILMAPLFK